MQMVRPRVRIALFQIYLPSLLMALGAGLIVPAIPLLGKTFSVSIGFAAQVVTAQVLGRIISMIPAGVFIDRFGVRLGMILGASVGVFSALLTVFAPSFLVILISQFLWGFGLNTWNIGRELAAIDIVSVEQRGRQLSALFGTQSTGTALGPALGGIILDTFGFRTLFVILAGIAAAVLAISMTVCEIQKHSHRTRNMMFGFTRISHIGRHFRYTYVILIIATFSATLRSAVLNSMLPIYVVNELGHTATTMGFLFFVIGLVTFLMIIPAGFISDKFGRKWATAPPAMLAGVAFVTYPLVKDIPDLLILSVMLGIANGMALGSMTTYTYDIVPHQTRAQLQAMRRTIGEMGSFLGPILGGSIANTLSAGISFSFFAPLHLLAALLLIFVAKESLPMCNNASQKDSNS